MRVYEVAPEDFGLQRAPLNEIAGGDAQQNAAIIRAILDGERSCRRDVVLLNAAAALVAAGHADRISDAVPLAAYAIDSADMRANGCNCWWSSRSSVPVAVDMEPGVSSHRAAAKALSDAEEQTDLLTALVR